MTGEMFKVIIADDHPLFRLALRESLSGVVSAAEIVEAACLDETLAALDDNGGDLILLDLRMPGAQGLSGLMFLRGHYPEIPIIVISGVDEPEIMRRAIDGGASGYIPKSTPPDQLAAIIGRIIAGDTWAPEAAYSASVAALDPAGVAERIPSLSVQQFKVLQLIADGKLNKQIAHEMDLSLSTVKAHVTALLRKLGLQRRTQIIAAMRGLDPVSYRDVES